MVINTNLPAEELKESLQAILRKGECEVIFRKNDGSEREMVCTLHPRYLPVMEEGSGTKKPPNPQVIAVWDIENEGWRSFRVDSIISGPTLVDR